MHAAFRQAVRWQAIAANPSDGVTPPKLEQARLRTPGPEDVVRLLGSVQDGYLGPITVAAMLGLRRGEVLALRWDSLDLDGQHPLVRIEGTLQRGRDGLAILPPKTERSRRSIPLPASAVSLLRKVRTEQLERRMLAGPAWSERDYVFDRGTGEPIDPDSFSKAVHAAVLAVGLDGVRLHDLRHAWATMQIAAGTDARTVSDQLGHATVAFTLQTYVHPSEEAAAAAAATTERLLGASGVD
jgi:integrase